MALKVSHFMPILLVVLITSAIVILYNYGTNSQRKRQFHVVLTEWNRQKMQHGNCYKYETTSSSVFGFVTTTRIQVRHGRAMTKSYQRWNKYGIIEYFNDTKEIIEYGDESTATLLSLDETYNKCLSMLQERSSAENYIHLSIDSKTPLLTTCGYTPHYCMDDCFMGHHISSLQWCDEDLLDSLDKWNQLKLQHGDCYLYQKHMNLDERMGYSMRIKIKDGIVIEKSIKPYGYVNTFIPDTYFDEPHSLTMDYVYQKCKLALHRKPDQNYVDFRIDEKSGLIAMCGFTLKNCIDDCYRGDIISPIEWCDG